MPTNGKQVACWYCDGSGITLEMNGEPEECLRCVNGTWWKYPSGTLAKWYGGPLIGSQRRQQDG